MRSVRRADAGIAELRAVLAHVEAPAERLAFVILAAADYRLTAADAAWLSALPPALQKSPAGLLAQGLVALRSGQPDRAVDLLEQAAPQGGTQRLVALAQALLQCRAEDGARRARELLAQLADGAAPEARYAATFVKLLGAR
jgi:hypothetical protein